MGLKILHSADWHLDSPFASFSGAQREALLREQKALPEKILSLAQRENCDLVLLAGDIFDTAPKADTLHAVKTALAQCGVPVFISPGNHDFCGPGSPWLEEDWPENVHIFTGKLSSVAVPELDCRVYGGGFQSMDCPPLLEDFHAEGAERWQIGVFHGDPTLKSSPYNPVTTGQIEHSGLQYLALGHIHTGGMIRRADTVCAWPGCPMGRGWDETGDKGVLLVTLGENARVQALPLDTIRFFGLETEGEDLLALLPPSGSRDFYRITLTGVQNQDLAQLREQAAAYPNLWLRDRREAPFDLWQDVGEDTLRGVYFSLLKEADGELAAKLSHTILSGREVKLP